MTFLTCEGARRVFITKDTTSARRARSGGALCAINYGNYGDSILYPQLGRFAASIRFTAAKEAAGLGFATALTIFGASRPTSFVMASSFDTAGMRRARTRSASEEWRDERFEDTGGAKQS
jgi:hypothetical protein